MKKIALWGKYPAFICGKSNRDYFAGESLGEKWGWFWGHFGLIPLYLLLPLFPLKHTSSNEKRPNLVKLRSGE
jgi:hypothetical protein